MQKHTPDDHREKPKSRNNHTKKAQGCTLGQEESGWKKNYDLIEVKFFCVGQYV